MAEACTFIDAVARAARASETPAGDFIGGMNNGSCQPGIGISVGPVDLREEPSSWTILDQNGAARTPQDGQSIGGVALGDGTENASIEPFVIVQPANDLGDGTVTNLGVATLTTLLAGWTAV